MLSGATGQKLATLMAGFKSVLTIEINDSVLDAKGMYTNVQVPNDVAKSIAREAYNLLVSVEAFFTYINDIKHANLLGRKELNDYIQEPGNKLVDNIKKIIKEKDKLSQSEKNQLYVLVKACQPLFGFVFDSAKKAVRTDVINQLIGDIQASPAIANKAWLERNALSVALAVVKGTSLPTFIIDLADTLGKLEKLTVPTVQAAPVPVIVAKPKQAVSSNSVPLDDSSLESFEDSSSEEQAATFADVAKHLDKIKDKQADFANSLASKQVTTFSQIKQAESENSLILARVNSLSDALAQIHVNDKAALEARKQAHQQRLDDANKSEVTLKKELTDQNTKFDEFTLKSDKLKALQNIYQVVVKSISEQYYFGLRRNDVAELINAKLNVDLKIEDLDKDFKAKFNDKFKDVISWTYELRMEFEAILKAEIENAGKELLQQETLLTGLTKKLANNVISIKKEEDKIAGLVLDIKQLDLNAEKEYLRIHHLLTLTSSLQIRLSRERDQINNIIKTIVANCKEQIESYKKARHKVYGAQDFFGGLAEKMSKPINGTFKSIKTQRYEYFDELNDALDDILANSEDKKAQTKLIGLLKVGEDAERFKPRLGAEQNDNLYVKTFQACIEYINNEIKYLPGFKGIDIDTNEKKLTSSAIAKK